MNSNEGSAVSYSTVREEDSRIVFERQTLSLTAKYLYRNALDLPQRLKSPQLLNAQSSLEIIFKSLDEKLLANNFKQIYLAHYPYNVVYLRTQVIGKCYNKNFCNVFELGFFRQKVGYQPTSDILLVITNNDIVNTKYGVEPICENLEEDREQILKVVDEVFLEKKLVT